MLTPGIISDSLNSDFLLQQEPDIHQVLDAGINNEGNVKPLPSLSLTKPDNDPVQNFFKTVGEKQTEEAKFAPSFLDYDASNIDRYKQADQWKQLGYNPEQGYQNEYKYGERQSWGDVMGNALGGAWELGANTFIEGWKGWGNMANALFNWGSDKTFTERLMGDDAELAVISKEQEDIMNKYAIFATPESENSIFNRQFFGSLVQQSGFALGTMAQFAAESVLTAGLSDALGLSEAKLAFNATKGMTIAQKAEKLKEIKQIGDVWWKSESVASKIFNAAAKATGIQDAVNLSKAGVGAKYLAMSGLGGTKRILSELNMARTEAMMEAAGTYGDLKKSMTADFLLKNDRTPSAAELNQIDQAAHNAALDNFKVNTGVLLLMNRIQFGNMFSKFGSKRSLLKGIESSYGDDIFSVTGMVDGKLKTTPFKKGMFGPMSSYAEIAGEFGKKKALWETTKYAGKGLLKWEGSEGVQELIQEGSNTTIKDYYTSLYDGDPRSEASWGSSIEKGVSSQANMQGLKTFLMGAVTGRLISPISYGMQKGMDLYKKATDKDYKSAFERREADINQSVSLLKEFYSDPAKYMPEWIANTKVQNKAAQDITTALKANSRYIYNNKRDSAFAKMISAAIKTDMIDSVLDTVKGYGDNLTPQQFNEAFGLEATDNNKQAVNDYFNKISNEVVDFHNTWKELKDKYSDRVMPQLYKEGEDRNRAYMAKRALDESIEILAINNYKARKAVVRSAEVLNEAAKNKGLGSSVYTGFNILGSDANTDREIALLTNEITQLEAAPSDPKTKELINDKKEELKHLVGWKTTYNTFTESDETNDKLAKLMLESFKGYMNVKNKQADSKSVVTDDDVNETFFRLTDYIKLNKDSKDFIDAFNIVADPKNWSNVHSNIMEGMLQARAELMKKHIKETAEGINQKNKDAESPDQNEFSDDELGDALMNALEQEQPETKNTQPADLEDFMMAEYTTAKKAADAQGIKIPDYEVWKKGAGKFVEERFNKMKNGTTAETTEEKPAKTSDIEAKKAELEAAINKQKEDLKKTTIGTPVGGIAGLNVGSRAVSGINAEVIDEFDSNYDPDIAENDGKGYSIVTRINDYGESKDGKLTKRPKIYVTTFNTKVEADAFLEKKKAKTKEYESRLGSGKAIDRIKSELAALEGKPSEKSGIEAQKADIKRRREQDNNAPARQSVKYKLQNKIAGIDNPTPGNNEIPTLSEAINIAGAKLSTPIKINDGEITHVVFDQEESTFRFTYKEKQFAAFYIANARGKLRWEIAKLNNKTGTYQSVTLDELKNISEKYGSVRDLLLSLGTKNLVEDIENFEKVEYSTEDKSSNGIIPLENTVSAEQVRLGKKYGVTYTLEDFLKEYDAELAALESKSVETTPIQELTSVKIGKYTLEVGDLVNGKEILAITPTHIIQDGIRNPITYSEMKSKLDAFAGNNITKKADITSTSKEKPLENGQIDNPGAINNALGKTASDSNKNIQNANPMLFGKGSPKVIPAGSKVNNRSDNYEEVTEGNKTFRKRTDTNEKYPVFVATTAFGIGDNLTLEVDYNIDNFEGRDGIVTKADFFVGDKIKDSVKEEFPIAIYTIHNGKKVKIGYVPTVSWLQERWADDSTKNVVEILTDDEGNEINNLEIQTEKLIKLREKIFENHNKNPNFVQNAIVNNKSEGVLRVMETGKEKLSVNLNPNDIQLGVIRKNEIFVNGTTSLLNEVGTNNIIVNFDDIENKNGWPVVILSTPTGKKLISYVSIPTLEEKDQDLIIEGWKAFKNMQDPAYKPSDFELDLVKNIYKQMDEQYLPNQVLNFDILQNYFNNYITFQSGRKLDPTMKEGTSQMNITKDGSLFVWVRDNNDPQQVLEIKNVSDLETKDAVLRDKLSKLYYNVRLSENNSMGIGNEKIYSMITLERNADNSFKIKLKDMTYKQHLMNTLETNIDKGVPVDENNPQSPWVYFANPVVTYDLTNTTLAEDTLKAAKDIVISDDSAAKEFGLDLSINKNDYKAHIINSDDELSDMLNECKIAQ